MKRKSSAPLNINGMFVPFKFSLEKLEKVWEEYLENVYFFNVSIL